MNKNLLAVFIFILLLVVGFWIMPNIKVDIIGDFFEKIIAPFAPPLTIWLSWRLGKERYDKWKREKGK